MAQIQGSGLGDWSNTAIVDDTGRLFVTGSITSMPSISVSANTGSEAYIKGGSISIYNMVAGSIVYMPSINVSAGSNVYIKAGSIQTYSPLGIGSVLVVNSTGSIGVYGNFGATGSEQYIKNFGELGSSVVVTNMVAGSIVYMPSISVAVGSESYIKAGSVQTYNPVGIGSVLVVNSTGSIGVYGNFGATGSEQYIKNTVEISGIVSISGIVAGSITSMPSISVAAGSESYLWARSGTTFVPLVATGEGYLQTDCVGSKTYIPAGSIQNVQSKDALGNAVPWIIGGSITLLSSFSSSGGGAVFYGDRYYADTLVSGPTLIGTNISGTTFLGITFSGTNINFGTLISGPTYIGTTISGVNFIASTLISGPLVVSSTVSGTNFRVGSIVDLVGRHFATSIENATEIYGYRVKAGSIILGTTSNSGLVNFATPFLTPNWFMTTQYSTYGARQFNVAGSAAVLCISGAKRASGCWIVGGSNTVVDWIAVGI